MYQRFLLNIIIIFFFIKSINGQQHYNVIGDAIFNGSDCYSITPSSDYKEGAIWFKDSIDLQNTFDLYYKVNFGCDNLGGDGLAFVIHSSGDSVAPSEGFIGYDSSSIKNSIAVEFDTYNGSAWGDNDLICHHTSIQLDGSTGAAATIEGPSCLLPGGAGVVDGLNHDICITWDPNILEYKAYFDGSLVGTFNGDIRFFFPDPTDVWWGFTSATGGAPQNQSVCNVVMETNILNPSCVCNPIIITASASSMPTTGLPVTTIPTC